MDSYRVAMTQLTNESYQIWRNKIEMPRERRGAWYVILEGKPENPSPQSIRDDTKANATIGLHIDDDPIGLICDCETAKHSWQPLKTYHEKASEITLLQLGEEGDMEEHVRKFSELLQRIAGSSEPIPKKWQEAMLLCSLPPSYDPLVTALEQRSLDELSLELVKSKLLDTMKPIILWTVKLSDTTDENAAKQIQIALTEKGFDVNIKAIDKNERSFQLDPNASNVLLCSNKVFNRNAKYLEQLVKNAASLDVAVVFLVEKTLYLKVGIKEAFPKKSGLFHTRVQSDLKNDENIVLITDKSWEETGLNSKQAHDIGKTILQKLEAKDKQLAK